MLTPDQQHVFEQLGMHPAFRAWVDSQLDAEFKVLKANPVMEQIFRAQGAVRILETIKAACERKQPKG